MVVCVGGSQDGRVMPENLRQFDTYNFLDGWRGMVDVYDTSTGELVRSYPTIGGPFAVYKPDRWDYERITRPDRIRANILANLPPGRPGRFQKAGTGS